MPSSGPGSRGGHVIGRTSSGKPIYASTHETYTNPKFEADPVAHVKQTHPTHTADEHREVALHHFKNMKAEGERIRHLIGEGHKHGSKPLRAASQAYGYHKQATRAHLGAGRTMKGMSWGI